MTNSLRIIQVGLGGWGWSWTQVVLDSSHWELAAVVDINQELLNKACQYYQINPNTAFNSLSEAVKEVEADAVLILVPPDYHANIALEAFEHGLHCIVEKPLAGTLEDCKKIVEAAERSGCNIMVSQNYRFKRAPQTVKKVIEQNVIGELGSVYINFQKSPDFTGFRTEMDEPLIIDMAIHHFDQIRGILGLEPVSVKAHSWNPTWSSFKGNAVASVVFEMSNGAVVSYTGSWVSRGWETTWDGDWRIQGEEGEIFWANNEVTVTPHDVFKSVFMQGAVEKNGKLEVDLVDLQLEERLASLQEFAESIHENREPETSGRDNLNSLAMVLGAVQSTKTGEKVYIEDVLAAEKREEITQ
ncbi:oxidoreductase [Bacillus sp. AFS076308]|uniref:Gfo/Idh/MocA family protein n=1 Tax=Bacillus sp. AFS076308 TaxID=2033512 RepID=UPI000BF84E00|nr:Gfo/Idh/MocA family oxidoreductase [Bacillus sp. AFS076308]PFN99581.1 oxidoreductase [Bacillus sp. AFS076308]